MNKTIIVGKWNNAISKGTKMTTLIIGLWLLAAACMTPFGYKLGNQDFSSTEYIRNVTVLCPNGVKEFNPVSGRVVCQP